MRYYLPEHGESLGDAQALAEEKATDHPALFAEYAGDDVFWNRDGNEMHWPVAIVVVDENGDEHRFSVDREDEPHFYATAES